MGYRTWAESKCTCRYNMKKYHCYHIFVKAVNEKLLTILIQFKNYRIGQKLKIFFLTRIYFF
jgi:hypothetical protein